MALLGISEERRLLKAANEIAAASTEPSALVRYPYVCTNGEVLMPDVFSPEDVEIVEGMLKQAGFTRVWHYTRYTLIKPGELMHSYVVTALLRS